ncbi:unnamed protein product, partial [Pleuronectes platessa]
AVDDLWLMAPTKAWQDPLPTLLLPTGKLLLAVTRSRENGLTHDKAVTERQGAYPLKFSRGGGWSQSQLNMNKADLMSLDCGRKPEKTHSDTGRTCKRHTERPRPDLTETRTSLLRGHRATTQ